MALVKPAVGGPLGKLLDIGAEDPDKVYKTGPQQEYARKMAEELLKKKPDIKHWTQGAAYLLDTLAGIKYQNIAGTQSTDNNTYSGMSNMGSNNGETNSTTPQAPEAPKPSTPEEMAKLEALNPEAAARAKEKVPEINPQEQGVPGISIDYGNKPAPGSTETGSLQVTPKAPEQPKSKSSGFTPKFPSVVHDAIAKAAADTGLPVSMLNAFAQIESGGRPGVRTGGYKGVLQLSDSEFKKYGGKNDIYNPYENVLVGARKLKEEIKMFEKQHGRTPDAADLYMVHQQGVGGSYNHLKNPDELAWKNMYKTGEGQRKGPGWAKLAIWGNVPTDERKKYGSVENMTSKQFTDMWRNKVRRFGGNADEAPPQAPQQPVGPEVGKNIPMAALRGDMGQPPPEAVAMQNMPGQQLPPELLAQAKEAMPPMQPNISPEQLAAAQQPMAAPPMPQEPPAMAPPPVAQAQQQPPVVTGANPNDPMSDPRMGLGGPKPPAEDPDLAEKRLFAQARASGVPGIQVAQAGGPPPAGIVGGQAKPAPRNPSVPGVAGNAPLVGPTQLPEWIQKQIWNNPEKGPEIMQKYMESLQPKEKSLDKPVVEVLPGVGNRPAQAQTRLPYYGPTYKPGEIPTVYGQDEGGTPTLTPVTPGMQPTERGATGTAENWEKTLTGLNEKIARINSAGTNEAQRQKLGMEAFADAQKAARTAMSDSEDIKTLLGINKSMGDLLPTSSTEPLSMKARQIFSNLTGMDIPGTPSQEQRRAIMSSLHRSADAALSGHISNVRLDTIKSSYPGVEQSLKGNNGILELMLQGRTQQAKFFDEIGDRRNMDITDMHKAWKEFKERNPIFITGPEPNSRIVIGSFKSRDQMTQHVNIGDYYVSPHGDLIKRVK